MSPEKLNAYDQFIKASIIPQFNEYKNDVFALGLTMLHATSLIDPSDRSRIFNLVKKELEDELKKLKVGKFYSKKFIDLLEALL